MWSPTLPSAWRVTLQGRLTFCFSRKQFTTFCKEMSLLPMTTCLHRNRAIGKEQLLGSTLRPVPTHMATPAASQNLASTELNNRQIAWENSRHFSTPSLVSLWNDVWEMTAENSYCWGVNTQFWVMLLIGRDPRENCNQKHYSELGSDTRRRQYEISAVISKRHFAEKPVVTSPKFGSFLKRPLRLLSQIKILTIEAKEKVSTYTG